MESSGAVALWIAAAGGAVLIALVLTWSWALHRLSAASPPMREVSAHALTRRTVLAMTVVLGAELAAAFAVMTRGSAVSDYAIRVVAGVYLSVFILAAAGNRALLTWSTDRMIRRWRDGADASGVDPSLP